MHFLSNESPTAALPFIGLAVFSLALLFSVTATNASLADLEGVEEPLKNQVASILKFSDEAVYATAVYTGIIPLEQSVYYYADVPTRSDSSRVAGAVTTSEPLMVIPQYEPEYEPLMTPITFLYTLFGGR